MELNQNWLFYWTLLLYLTTQCCRTENAELAKRSTESEKKVSITVTEKLRKDLLADYHLGETKSVPVNITLVVSKVGLDYKESAITVNGYLIQQWFDTNIKWNTSKYDEVKRIQFAAYKIWRPDITFLNSITGYIGLYDDRNLIVNSDGSVFWMPSMMYKVYCKLDIVKWPFDTQNCSLQLCPRSYTNSDIILSVKHNEPVIILNTTAADWKILDVKTTSIDEDRVVYWEDGPKCTSIVYSIVIEKYHVLYYAFLTLPAFGILTLLLSSFWLLPEKIEKLLLTGLVSAVSALYLLFFSVKIPVLLYQTPNIIKFYGWMLSLSSIYMIITIALHNLSTRITKMNPPSSCTKLLNFCGRTIFFITCKRINPSIYDDFGDTDAIEENVDCDATGESDDGFFNSKNDAKRPSNVAESKRQRLWKIIVAAIDSFCFIIYAVIGVIVFLSYI